MSTGPMHTWPLKWRDVARLAVAYLLMSAVWIGAGLLVDGPLDSSVGALDRRVARRMVAHRTSRVNRWSHWGTLLSETAVKIVVTLIIATVLFAVWRHWSDVLVVCVALALEASVFLTVTLVVDRHRPRVPHLDSSPVGSSFPSGHVAAAAAYAALCVVLWRRSHHRTSVIIGVLVVAVAIIVAWARMYRGMHYLSDVIAGAALGALSVVVTALVVPPPLNVARDEEPIAA